MTRDGQRGQAVPLVLGAAALVVLGALAAGALGAVLLARSRAQAAADLVALSAARAQPLSTGPGGPAAAARPVAQANGVRLVRAGEVGDPASPGAVEVEVASAAPLDLEVRAVARAGWAGAGVPGVVGGGAGARAAAWALTRLGVPYRWGGADDAGYDCSGLTWAAWRAAGVEIGRDTHAQLAQNADISGLPLHRLRPGDLLFPHAGHVVMYLGGGRIVEAPYTGAVVRVGSVLDRAWPMMRRPGPAAGGAQPPAGATPAAVPAWVPPAYRGLVARSAAAAGIPPALLGAVLRAESDFDPRAVSSAGAQGIAQLMPDTARSLGVDAFDPAQAVPAAARLLAGLWRDLGGWPLALAAYNAGPGAVRRHGGIPPFAETQAYVARVMAWAGPDAALAPGAGVVLLRAGRRPL